MNGAATLAANSSALALGQTHTTLYLSDPQFEHLGPRAFIDNPLIDYFIPSADRNLVSVATAPVFVDTLMHHVRESHDARSIQILGDVPDTPCNTELGHMEKILERHPVPVEGYDRGNHSSSNAFGVVNMFSRVYGWVVGLLKRDPLKEEVCKSCSGCKNVLTTQETMRGMHRIVHRHRTPVRTVEETSVRVAKADAKSYALEGSSPVAFSPENRGRDMETFWKPTPDRDGKTRFWEAVVNFHVAEEMPDQRSTKVNPFYLQACEEARFVLDDGSEVPVYNINLDSLDHGHVLAVQPAISELQVRLVQAFIEQKLLENPNARFKLSAHFSSVSIAKGSSCATREIFKQLLSREEIILFSGGHTHQRELTDLTAKLGLKRRSRLTEIIVPSLVDYHPSQSKDSKIYQDARALVIETMKVEKDSSGRPALKIDLEYQGLDREDLKSGRTPEVEERLKWFKENHGYQRAKETVDNLKWKHIRGFAIRRLRRVGEFFTQGLVPFRWQAFKAYWKRNVSPLRRVMENFTVVSTVQMFNECEHFIPFLKSVVHFMKLDETDSADNAARLQIQGVLNTLEIEYNQRRPQFEAEVLRGDSAETLQRFNDLYERAGIHLLPELFLQLKLGGQARAFVVLAGLDASQEEFEYHRGRPTKIPNNVPTISVPIS